MAMLRLKPIRRVKRRGIPRDVRRVADTAFCVVLALALGLTMGRVASGFPQLVDMFIAHDTMSAQASVAPRMPAPRLPVGQNSIALRPLRDQEDTAVAVPPIVAIVIDDLGADVVHTRAAIRLPNAVALAFLPNPELDSRFGAARRDASGMRFSCTSPCRQSVRRTPGRWRSARRCAPDENIRRLDWALARVPGFAGINNHEGSLFTADRAALVPVIEHLTDRRVFVFDSRTTASSQVVSVARAFGIASAARDVFLDDVLTIDAVDAQLRILEARARETGIAIAIGHPHEITLDAVAYWTAHRSGYSLVPLSEAIRLKTERDARRSLSLAGG